MIHDEDLWEEDEFLFPPRFLDIPNPDEVWRPSPSDVDVTAPSQVPHVPESLGQWAVHIGSTPAYDNFLPRPVFHTCVRLLVELPVCATRLCIAPPN